MVLLDGIEVKLPTSTHLTWSSIERIEVVQGAAAAIMYGAQGRQRGYPAFLQKGKNGKIQVDLSSSLSRQQPAQYRRPA